jgi:hypothetical protein
VTTASQPFEHLLGPQKSRFGAAPQQNVTL